MVTYKGEEPATETKRQKLRENKTILLPNQVKELPELELPEFNEKPKKKGLKSLFGFGKKELPQEPDEKEIEEPVKEDAELFLPKQVEEPEILKEIDTGHHTHEVEPELAMWLNDGRIVKSLDELRKALKTMSNRTFNQHRDRKDLAEWVRDVMGNKEMAAFLRKAQSRKEAISLLEQHKKEWLQRTKESEKVKEIPKHAEPKPQQAFKQPEEEIEQAIQKLTVKALPEKREKTFEEREQHLDEKERLLDLEEDHLNAKRMELANRRYAIIKERGNLEKERFEKLVKQHRAATEDVAPEKNDFPMQELEITEQAYSKEKILSLLEEAKRYLMKGDYKAAEKIEHELKAGLEYTALTPEETKRIEYDILELEADIKLAALA